MTQRDIHEMNDATFTLHYERVAVEQRGVIATLLRMMRTLL